MPSKDSSAFGLDDVNAAAAGIPYCFDGVFLSGGAIGGGYGGAGNGVVGEGDVAGHGHDLRHGGRGACEGEEETGEQHV